MALPNRRGRAAEARPLVVAGSAGGVDVAGEPVVEESATLEEVRELDVLDGVAADPRPREGAAEVSAVVDPARAKVPPIDEEVHPDEGGPSPPETPPQESGDVLDVKDPTVVRDRSGPALMLPDHASMAHPHESLELSNLKIFVKNC